MIAIKIISILLSLSIATTKMMMIISNSGIKKWNNSNASKDEKIIRVETSI